MLEEERKTLARELEELFDIKKARLRDEKRLDFEAQEAQKDIKLLTLMFRDGIPDIQMKISENEDLKWDGSSQQLLYITKNNVQIIEGTSLSTRIKIRPHLKSLVKKAKEFYLD